MEQGDDFIRDVSCKPVLAVLDGNKTKTRPIWLMRQAGRYLPEYREIRAKANNFIEFCYSPAMAAEATLQPIRRFGFDAAILFSDILVVPDALGQKVAFETGEGPRLQPLVATTDIERLPPLSLDRLAPVFETIDRVRSHLPAETAFLGFCGAPWTVASYMIAGRGTPDHAPARLFAYRHPTGFQLLIDKLVAASIDYLSAQFRAGVDAVQIFDSWAGICRPGNSSAGLLNPSEKSYWAYESRFPARELSPFPVAPEPVTSISSKSPAPMPWASIPWLIPPGSHPILILELSSKANSTRWRCWPADWRNLRRSIGF